MKDGVISVMLDLETMSVESNAAIIAIGAVRFTLEDGVLSRFSRVVDLQSCLDHGLVMDADTVLWWLRQSDEARAEFSQPGMALPNALDDFYGWMGGSGDQLVWGDGERFDNVILANAFRAAGRPLPWDPKNGRCYKTVRKMFPGIRIERVGVHHRAVDDAESQAEHLIRIWRGIGVKIDGE